MRATGTVARMQLRTASTRFILGTIACAAALVGCGSDSKTSPTTVAAAETTMVEDEPATTNAPATPAEVADGSVTIVVTVGADDFDTTGGTRVVSVPKGTTVTVELTDAATDEEYHLHGYDVEVSAAKGETGSLSFTADQVGQFDLESHNTETTLLVVVVVI